MQNYLTVFFLASCSWLLLSCQIPNYNTPTITNSLDSQSSSRQRRQRSSFSGDRSQESDACSESSKCKEMCEDMFLKASALSSCFNFTEDQVQGMADAYGILRNPRSLSDLEDVDLDGFADFLRVDYTGFLDLIDPVMEVLGKEGQGDLEEYDPNHARYVLEWMATDEDVARAFSKARNEGSILILESLFKVYGEGSSPQNPTSDDKIQLSSVQEISSDHSRSVTDLDFFFGFIENGFDRVHILSYAKSLRNDIFSDLVVDTVSSVCGSSTSCIEAHYCAAEQLEGSDYYVNEFIGTRFDCTTIIEQISSI